jgi:2-(1,2-epoxy-1,2-dihydrophenyl)acetyl-CoA isomerase
VGYDTLGVTTDGGVATIRLARPDRANSVNIRMVTELHDAVAELAVASAIRVVILTGSGRWFSPGGDVKAFENGEFAAEVEQGYDPGSWRIPELLHGMPQITIAAVNGPCAGAAFGWACACDIRVAARGATFSTAFLGLGLSGDMAVPWTLPRIIGNGPARWLSFVPDRFSADRAYQLGLVSQLFDDDALSAEVAALALRLARYDAQALQRLKQHYLIAESSTLSELSDVEINNMDLRQMAAAFSARPGSGHG